MSVGERMEREPYSESMPINRLNPVFCPTDKIQFKYTLIAKRPRLSLVFLVSVGGLEPPQISPHAPQTCASTVPPHRHFHLIFKLSILDDVAEQPLRFCPLVKCSMVRILLRQSATPTLSFNFQTFNNLILIHNAKIVKLANLML